MAAASFGTRSGEVPLSAELLSQRTGTHQPAHQPENPALYRVL